MVKEFDCSRCPFYNACGVAHLELLGGVIAGRLGISTYEECPLYMACRDATDLLGCLKSAVEKEWNSWIDEY